MSSSQELMRTVLHLQTMGIHVQEAENIPQIFDLGLTEQEKEKVLEALGEAKEIISEVYDSYKEEQEQEEVTRFEDMLRQ